VSAQLAASQEGLGYMELVSYAFLTFFTQIILLYVSKDDFLISNLESAQASLKADAKDNEERKLIIVTKSAVEITVVPEMLVSACALPKCCI
jgi:hypothetical protein